MAKLKTSALTKSAGDSSKSRPSRAKRNRRKEEKGVMEGVGIVRILRRKHRKNDNLLI